MIQFFTDYNKFTYNARTNMSKTVIDIFLVFHSLDLQYIIYEIYFLDGENTTKTNRRVY